jgi:hypothetical protein
MERTTWPERDQRWVERYRRSMAGKHVPTATLERRERELLDAVRETGVPAAELLGDADALAADDVSELATVEEAVRTAEGGGLRPALREVGGMLVSISTVGVVLVFIRAGWTTDIEVGGALVAASVAAVFVGWVVARALLAAGRPHSGVGVLVAVGAFAAGGIAWAASLGPGYVAARDVPVALLGVGLIAPGILTLMVAGRMPDTALSESWDDTEWLRRFRYGLRSRFVPSATARDHVAEVEQAIVASAASAFAEYGHPLVLARRLAQVDHTARARRWWVSTVAGAGTPLIMAALILAMDSWRAFTVPVVVFLVLGALVTLVVGWGDRPWANRR